MRGAREAAGGGGAEANWALTTKAARVILSERSERKDRYPYRDLTRYVVTAVNCLAWRAILSALRASG